MEKYLLIHTQPFKRNFKRIGIDMDSMIPLTLYIKCNFWKISKYDITVQWAKNSNVCIIDEDIASFLKIANLPGIYILGPVNQTLVMHYINEITKVFSDESPKTRWLGTLVCDKSYPDEHINIYKRYYTIATRDKYHRLNENATKLLVLLKNTTPHW